MGPRCRSRASTSSTGAGDATRPTSRCAVVAIATSRTGSTAASSGRWRRHRSPRRRRAAVASIPMSSPDSTITRLEAAADLDTGVRFVGNSVMGPDGPARVPWRQIHDEARAVGAALQARGLLPGDHVAILGPTSRELMTIIRGCWMAGIASMVLPLPMRMGSLETFIESTRARIRHGDAKLVLIDDQLAAFYEAADGDPPIEPMRTVMPGSPGVPSGERLEVPPDDPDRLVILQYTSGSTSEPKGVMIPDRVLTANIDACCQAAAPRRRGGDGVVAAAVPRHGSRRIPVDPDDEGRRPRPGGTPGLPRASGELDALDLGASRHRHRRSELLLGARHAGPQADEAGRDRPVLAHARPVGGRTGRPEGGRGVRRRGRSIRVRRRVGCSPRSAWPRWRSVARSRHADVAW